MKKILLLSLLAVIALYSCKEKKITMSDNGTTVNVALGQEIMIELPTDATVKRTWKNLIYNDSVLVQKGKPYSRLTGNSESPGVYEIRFEAVNVGTSNISIEYCKLMGKDKETPIDIFEVEIKVHEIKPENNPK